MARTTNLEFWTLDQNLPNWHHMYNANIDIFLQNRARLLSLQDIDIKALQHGSIVQYNTSTQKWEVIYERRT